MDSVLRIYYHFASDGLADYSIKLELAQVVVRRGYSFQAQGGLTSL